eukprot:scaffold12235_cov44-Attheya_sp.AAC.6
MKPAWDQLDGEYAGSSSVLIGDADCTESGKDLCTKVGVQGYPTIKYYKDGDEHDYNGGRDLTTLQTFVDTELVAKCVITSDNEGCSDKETKYIVKMRTKSPEDRASQLVRLEKMKDEPMKPELKSWLSQRLRILLQFDNEDSPDL